MDEQPDEGGNQDDGDELVPFGRRMLMFLQNHHGGIIAVVTPLLLLPIVLPWPGEVVMIPCKRLDHTQMELATLVLGSLEEFKPEAFGLPPFTDHSNKYQWCAFCLCVMAVYWVTECIPLPVTSFLPVVIFPLTGVMDATKTCQCYINDTVLVFIGSLFLAAAVEQSGLHKRLAYGVIRMIGYSHYKLLFAMSFVTMFVSMWLSNTAATTMMVPINFALLKVFEDQDLLSIYDKTEDGDRASDITTCYFCSASFSATIGGIGTLVGTGTNLVFKGLLEKQYPNAPEYLSFPLFSAFAVPYMLVMESFLYLCMIIKYFGFLRPKSKEAKAAIIPSAAVEAAKEAVERDAAALGPISFWEYMVILLFGSAIILFFCRSPQIFSGWGNAIVEYFDEPKTKYVRDSVVAMGVCFVMLLLPASLKFFNNCTAKTYGDLPDGRVSSVLDWRIVDSVMPYSFMFLLGGGFALSTAALKENSDLNGKIGDILALLDSLPNVLIVLFIIIFTIFLTNFASNVAVSNVVVPIGMALAENIEESPFLYNIACGYSASYCFCLPVGTPGNLIVQSAAKISTKKMIIAGVGPTVTTILITWMALLFWAPVIWPDLRKSFADIPWVKS